MKRSKRVIDVLLMLALLMWVFHVSAQPAAGASDIEERYSALQKFDREKRPGSERDRDDAIASEYARLFSGSVAPDVIQQTSDADLVAVFKASYLAAFYAQREGHLSDMRQAFATLEQRGVASAEQAADMFRTFIAYRRFDDARALLARYSDLPVEPVPDVEMPSGISDDFNAYVIADEGLALTPSAIDITTGTHLVVIAHPLCHFSRNAVTDLDGDAQFASVFSSRAIWLAPVNGRLNVDVLKTWNREHPTAHTVLARDKASWPLIDDWATPQFYAIRDGVVIGRVTGWPKEGNKVALKALLATLDASHER